jgi:hypothetical protein
MAKGVAARAMRGISGKPAAAAEAVRKVRRFMAIRIGAILLG